MLYNSRCIFQQKFWKITQPRLRNLITNDIHYIKIRSSIFGGASKCLEEYVKKGLEDFSHNTKKTQRLGIVIVKFFLDFFVPHLIESQYCEELPVGEFYTMSWQHSGGFFWKSFQNCSWYGYYSLGEIFTEISAKL